MARKHKPEEIISKLREAEIVLAQGGTVADACRRIGVTEQSYYRWRKEYDRYGYLDEAVLLVPPPAPSIELAELLDRAGKFGKHSFGDSTFG